MREGRDGAEDDAGECYAEVVVDGYECGDVLTRGPEHTALDLGRVEEEVAVVWAGPVWDPGGEVVRVGPAGDDAGEDVEFAGDFDFLRCEGGEDDLWWETVVDVDDVGGGLVGEGGKAVDHVSGVGGGAVEVVEEGAEEGGLAGGEDGFPDEEGLEAGGGDGGAEVGFVFEQAEDVIGCESFFHELDFAEHSLDLVEAFACHAARTAVDDDPGGDDEFLNYPDALPVVAGNEVS